MHQYTLNNWFQWYYDDELFGRQDLTNFKKYTNRWNSSVKEYSTYREELRKTALSTLEHFNGKDLTLCFSGGMDSEIVLRSYLDIGHPIKVVIYKYEDNLNEVDVQLATKICEQLNSPYQIIDFNVSKFFENDAASMIKPCQIDKPLQLIGCKFLEITEGIPILGEGDLLVNVRPANDPTDDHNYYWAYSEWSSEICREQYLIHLNKSAIPKWLQWRPEVLLCALESDYTKKLVTLHTENVFTSRLSKHELYSQYFPDLIKRQKLSGFENFENAPFINEFKKEIIKQNGIFGRHIQPYDRTVKQAINELKGLSWFS
jgi:hypothetical protein